MSFIPENDVEIALLEQLDSLGYQVESEDNIGPDGKHPERAGHDEVILQGRLEKAVAKLNPSLESSIRQEAMNKVVRAGFPSLMEENRRIHELLSDGVAIEHHDRDGFMKTSKVKLIDFDHPENNDWVAVNQFTVIHGENNRRPDVVVFVNGLPLAVIELKAPGSEEATLLGAYNQLQTYKKQIPALFNTNALLVTSDGLTARVGSLSANFERFMPWRTTDGTRIAPKGSPEQATLIEGVFEKRRFLDLLRNFTVFGDSGAGLIKIIAGYHQYHAVKHAVEQTILASSPEGDKRAGVIWHTQGSGKSLLMAFYAGQLVKRTEMANPTLVVLTDRNDLDDQLFGTFSMCKDLLRQTPVQAESREHLQSLLSRASGGVIFTTLQKFGEIDEPLTTRRNVVVIADEAHRSQYGFRAKVDVKTGEISYGFAKYMRDALPNASFIGFTGTPIEATDVNTPAVFGEYIDVYDISRAVEDGATVPIYYESRLARVELDEAEQAAIDAKVDELTEDDSEQERESFKQKWSRIEAIVGSDRRLAMVAKDLVEHFEKRVDALEGKAMVVCMSRQICVKLYKAITQLRPEWHSDDDHAGAIKIVMTGAASDPQDWQPHIGNKARRDLLAKRMRDPNDPLKIVIVRDMWLTGFDAPCLHTMYVDKPMQGHGLMQAIARVNRVFRDKPAGLIVDYIGLAQKLKSALNQYSPSDQAETGIDESKAVAVLQEKHEIVQAMFHGFDYQSCLTGTASERLARMAQAIEWILDLQHKLAEQETTQEGKKQANRRYQDNVLALSKAFALASASEYAASIRDEVGFFQAIRAALVKSSGNSGFSRQERDIAIQQLVSKAVVSTEIVDILKGAGIQTPDISILSDEFLEEIKNTKLKNVALEALRKLLNDSIRSRSKSNIVESRAFSERLQNAVARYHSNAITTAQILEELIQIAKDIRAARQRGEESGLSDAELAFYDALAENNSAVEVLGNDKLKLIAHELMQSLRQNVSVDWMHRESARAQMRVLVKRILRKYGYPPDLQDAAVKLVLQQAELVLSAEFS